MYLFRKHAIIKTVLISTLLIIYPVSIAAQSSTRGEIDGELIWKIWDRIRTKRSNQEYDEALQEIYRVIRDYEGDERMLRRAYNELVYTLRLKGDLEVAIEKAGLALQKYPDLTADFFDYGIWINDTYDAERKKMFGSLISEDTKGFTLSLDDSSLGKTPLSLELVPVGIYTLKAEKPGWKVEPREIAILPNTPWAEPLRAKRIRDVRWYLSYVFPPLYIIGCGILAYVIISGQGTQQLSSTPPPPPAN